MATSDAPDDISTAFSLLAHPRRRDVLELLTHHQSPVSIDEVAEAIAARETDTPVDELAADRIETVRISLSHVHLPKLAAANVIQWTPTAETIATGDAERVLAYLDQIRDANQDQTAESSEPLP